MLEEPKHRVSLSVSSLESLTLALLTPTTSSRHEITSASSTVHSSTLSTRCGKEICCNSNRLLNSVWNLQFRSPKSPDNTAV